MSGSPRRGFVLLRTLSASAAAVLVVAASRTVRTQDRLAAPGFSFTNVAREAGLNHVTVFGGSASNKYLLETTGTGVAFIDYDNDGWLDLFFVNGTTLEGFPPDKAPTNHLYRNKGDGTFDDVTAQAGVAGRPVGAGQRCPVRLRGRADRDALVRPGRRQRPASSAAGVVAL